MGWHAVRSELELDAVQGLSMTGQVDGDDLRWSDVAKLARRTRRRLVRKARADDAPTLGSLIASHLRVPLADLEVVAEGWPQYDHVNVQVGLDHWLAEAGRSHRLVGLTRWRGRQFGLADLLRREDGPDDDDYGPRPGNVAWLSLPSGPEGQVVRAVAAGLYLVDDGDARAALLLTVGDPDYGSADVKIHIVADRPGAAELAAGRIRELALLHNVYRGQVVSFEREMFGERQTALHFHRRPHLRADQVVLPRETLDAVRRQVVGVAEHREFLRDTGQHLKRGLLLFGPPGVGKTHTVRHLLSELSDFTIVLLTGPALQLIGTAASLARTLQPAMIVVEDVDLIAEERGMRGGQHPLLFQLLNEMDGLADDSDVVFLLTTNRADLLEPALAARPGRVDQAVELLLPDREARTRLFDLYAGSLEVDRSGLDRVLDRTEGVTASFLKELLRRAALVAAQADTGVRRPRVSGAHLDAALDELLDTRNAMTRAVLGAGSLEG